MCKSEYEAGYAKGCADQSKKTEIRMKNEFIETIELAIKKGWDIEEFRKTVYQFWGSPTGKYYPDGDPIMLGDKVQVTEDGTLQRYIEAE